MLLTCNVMLLTCNVMLLTCNVMLLTCNVMLLTCNVMLLTCNVMLLTCNVMLLTGGGPTPFLYMATRFLANVHVQNVQNVQKLFFPVWKFPGKIYLLWLIHNDRYITWECI